MAETVQLDDTDRRLLRVLQRDGRISNLDLAQQCHLSPSACSERVRRLRERGVITGFSAILDPKAIDRALLIFVDPARPDKDHEFKYEDVAEFNAYKADLLTWLNAERPASAP